MLRPAVFLVAHLLVCAPAYGHEPSNPGAMLSPEVQHDFETLATVKALEAVQTTLLVFFAAKNGITLGEGVVSVAREKYHEGHRELREKALRNARTSLDRARVMEIYRILQTVGDDYFNTLQASVDAGRGLVR